MASPGSASSGLATAASAAVAVPSSVVDPLAAAPAADGEPQLDANKLHVYHVALELHTLCATVVGSLQRIRSLHPD